MSQFLHQFKHQISVILLAERTRHFRRCSGKVWIGTVSVEISVYPCVTVGLCVSVVMVGWGVVGVYGIKGIHLEKQGRQIYINYHSGQNLFWLLVAKNWKIWYLQVLCCILKKISFDLTFFLKMKTINSKVKSHKELQHWKPLGSPFFWSFYSFGCRNLTCRYKHQMDRSNTNWDRNGTEIIQCQFKKKED